jgi:hypothetical protein
MNAQKPKQWRAILHGDKTFTFRMNAPPPGYGTDAKQPSSGASGLADSSSKNLNTIFQRDSLKYYKKFPDYMKSFRVFSSEMATMSSGMGRMVSALMRFGPIGALGGLAGMMAAMDSASRNVVEDRKRALALGGADVGKMRAAGLAFGNLPINVPSAVANISDAQFDVTKRRALLLLGFTNAQISGTDPSDLFVDALKREQQKIKSYKDKGLDLPLAQATGATDFWARRH